MRAGKGIYALSVALLAASPVAADYKDSYSRGLEAAKDGDWATVRQRMQEAIQDNPTAAPRVRLYGQRWEPYVPQFYLGLAAFKQGDCSTALAQWRESLRAIHTPFVKQHGYGQVTDVRLRQTIALVSEAFGLKPSPQPQEIFAAGLARR